MSPRRPGAYAALDVVAGEHNWTVLTGEGRQLLRQVPDECIHTVVTSPPYWGLRSYGTEPQMWGGDPSCAHEWEQLQERRNAYRDHTKRRWQHGAVQSEEPENWRDRSLERGELCARCGAWRGELGLEPTPYLYVEHLVEFFREVWRVLRDDGVLWLNIADSYIGGGRGGDTGASGLEGSTASQDESKRARRRPRIGGLKVGDLAGVPQRLVLALQADGWYWRADVVWFKPNGIPESAQNRPTKAHEYVYLLTKRPRYYYDYVAVMEPCESGPSDVRKMLEGQDRIGGKHQHAEDKRLAASKHTALGRKRAVGGRQREQGTSLMRNRRSVWIIATEPYGGPHFATFPKDLAEVCIRAGTSAFGCCAACGTPYRRLTRKTYLRSPDHGAGSVVGRHYPTGQNNFDGAGMPRLNAVVETIGWESPYRKKRSGRPRKMHPLPEPKERGGFISVDTVGSKRGCECGKEAVLPCVVLDPFCGSGRAGVVARRLGRRFIGIDLSPKYAEMARSEIADADAQLSFLAPHEVEPTKITVYEEEP